MIPRVRRSIAFEPTEEQIQHCAYFLWEEMGRPAGRDLEIWDAARERLKHSYGALKRAGNPRGVVPQLPPPIQPTDRYCR